MEECYFTTAQFAAGSARAVHKHCGPTAVTNLLCTLHPPLAQTPQAVFDEVAALGRRQLAYWNVASSLPFGGTSDALAGRYLRSALALYGCCAEVRFGGVATAARLRAVLGDSAVVYAALHAHPRYRNHHLLIYGSQWQGLRAADGWQRTPVFLHERDLRLASFFVITPQ